MMSSSNGQPNTWSPNLKFLKSGQITIDIGSLKENITWNFNNLKSFLPGITNIECEINAFGVMAKGYGDGFSLHISLIKAFAEAFERAVMLAKCPEASSSNGFSAERNQQLAIYSSRNELLERSILLEAWKNKYAFSFHHHKSITVKFYELFLKQRKIKLEYFKINSNAGEVLAVLAQHSNGQCLFDSTYLVPMKKQTQDAERRLLLSVNRNLGVFDKCKLEAEWKLPEKGLPEDHRKFYLNPANKIAFDFLKKINSNENRLILPEVEKIKSEVIFEHPGLPVVANSHHTKWKKLEWGKCSIDGINPWPHPLA